VPWHISENEEGCSGYAVVKDDDGSVAGCHDTLPEAEAQMAALYASEPDTTATTPAEFHGPLALEGVPTGDGRQFAAGALEWREPPLPLMWLVEDAHGGETGASFQVGRIERLVRRGQEVWGYGTFDLESEWGGEAARRVHDGYLRGISVDLQSDADVEVIVPESDEQEEGEGMELLFGPPADATLMFHQATIMGATLCAFPALAGAHLRSGPGNPDAAREPEEVTVVMTASGSVGLLLGGRVVPASLVRMNGDRFTVDLQPEPSYAEWVESTEFADPPPPPPPPPPPAKPDEESPEEEEAPKGQALVDLLEEALAAAKAAVKAGDLTVEMPEALDGTLVASGLPHLLAPPHEWFDDPALDGPTHLTVTDDGRVFGHLALWNACHTSFQGQCVTAPHSGTNYANFRAGEVLTSDGERVSTGVITLDTNHADISLTARPAKEHYDHTGVGVADVAAGEDAWGIWLAGAMRPTATPEHIRTLRASHVSGDWRGIPGFGSDLMAVLAVNVPGFPVPRLHSRSRGDELVALVAGAALFTDEAIREALATRIGRTPEVRRAELARRVHPVEVAV
jgi:hypothetical protein